MSLVGCLAGTLAYFVSGFFYMVGFRLCDALSRCRHIWADMTPQGVIDLYHFIYNIFLQSHQAWVSDRFVKRHERRAW